MEKNKKRRMKKMTKYYSMQMFTGIALIISGMVHAPGIYGISNSILFIFLYFILVGITIFNMVQECKE